MSATDSLREDHKQIRRLDKVIIKCYTDLYAGKNIPISDLEKITVIITTIGLGKSKKIPPPDSIQGGFVKPSDDSSDNQIISEEVDEYHKKLDGGFVKPSDDSKK